jgi:hypothetical protein
MGKYILGILLIFEKRKLKNMEAKLIKIELDYTAALARISMNFLTLLQKENISMKLSFC